MTEGDPCPVCGWAVVREEHIPENPDPDHGPDAPGTQYVHHIEAIGNGRFRIKGCSEYENGETDAWVPPESSRQYQMTGSGGNGAH